MRFHVILWLSLLLSGCAVQPIDLKIPKDHPANPGAAAVPPSHSNYIYTLPTSSNFSEKAAVIGRPDQGMSKASDHVSPEAQHLNPTKGMHPHENGKANED